MSLYRHLLCEGGETQENVVVAGDVIGTTDWRESFHRLTPGARVLVLTRSHAWGDPARVRRMTLQLQEACVSVHDVLWVGTSVHAPQFAIPYGDRAALRWFMSQGYVPCSRREAMAAALVSRRLGSFAVPLAFPVIALICRRGHEEEQ